MSPAGKTPDEWGDIYRRQRSTYEQAAKRYRWLIKDLLKDEGFEVAQIEQRAKSVESFVKKVDAKKDGLAAPLDEITDLAGVRVITYYLEDADGVVRAIRERFEVDEERSVSKTSEWGPAEFGYTGEHLIVRHGIAHELPPGWTIFADRWIEIQVRTSTQHAWAAVDHKLKYKSAYAWPPELERRLARLSALFELADDQFSVLRWEYRELEKRYADALEGGELDIELDSASLAAYLAQTDRIAPIVAKAEALGWRMRPDEEVGRPIGQRPVELRYLLHVLGMAGLSSVRDFDEFLSEVDQNGRALEWLGQVDPDLPPIYPEDLLDRLLIVRRQPPEQSVREVFPELAEGLAKLRELKPYPT
jgi:putative GTP pyrophosphokinase